MASLLQSDFMGALPSVCGRERRPANPEQVNKPGGGDLFEISKHRLLTVTLGRAFGITANKFLQYTYLFYCGYLGYSIFEMPRTTLPVYHINQGEKFS